MNICHVITRMIVGGAQENTLYSVRGHLDHGHPTKLISGKTSGPEGNLLEKVRIPNLDVTHVNHLRREIHPYHDCLAFHSLVRIFKRNLFYYNGKVHFKDATFSGCVFFCFYKARFLIPILGVSLADASTSLPSSCRFA